jgi:hypothetical protein
MTCSHCGGKERSTPQHRRFYAVVRAAFDQWPDESIDNPEHLRKFLLVKVKHRKQNEIHITGDIDMASIKAMESAMRAAGEYAWTVEHNGKVYVLAAKSISYGKLPHREACGVFESVEAVICDVLGIQSCDQLLKEKENSA